MAFGPDLFRESFQILIVSSLARGDDCIFRFLSKKDLVLSMSIAGLV